MKPINFPQATKVLQRPSKMTEKECHSLHVWNDGRQCVSCWRPTITERFKIFFGGNVWLGVLSGKTQPPVFIEGDNVFNNLPFLCRLKGFILETKESIIEAYNNVKNGFKQPDKRKHLIAGYFISLIVGVFLPWLGLLTGCGAGALKEWWDSKGHGRVELMDFFFTVLGSLIAFPFAFVINFLTGL